MQKCSSIARVIALALGAPLLLSCDHAPPSVLPIEEGCSSAGVAICDAYLATISGCSKQVPPERLSKLTEDRARCCNESLTVARKQRACGDGLLDLFDEPACQLQAATVFTQLQVPRSPASQAPNCGTKGHTSFTPDPRGKLEIGARNEVTLIAPVGDIALTLDGVAVWVASVGPGHSTLRTLGPIRGKIDAGEHAVEMLWVLRSQDSEPSVMSRRCITIREDVPLRITAVLEDSEAALSVDAPVRARLQVQ